MVEELTSTKLRSLILSGIGLCIFSIVVTAIRFPGLLKWTSLSPELLLVTPTTAWYVYLAIRRTRTRTSDDSFVLSYGMKWGIAMGCVLTVSMFFSHIVIPHEPGMAIGFITMLVALLLPLVASVIGAMKTRSLRIGMGVGFWSGLVGGLIGCVVIAALGYILAFIPGLPGAEIPPSGRPYTLEEFRRLNVADSMGGALSFFVAGSIFGLATGTVGGLIGFPLDPAEAEPVVSTASSELQP